MLTPLDRLSSREQQVLRLVTQGRANKQIATELQPPCSEGTVKVHLRDIYAELGVSNRAEAAAMWIRCGGD